jgi:hypothetical protein
LQHDDFPRCVRDWRRGFEFGAGHGFSKPWPAALPPGRLPGVGGFSPDGPEIDYGEADSSDLAVSFSRLAPGASPAHAEEALHLHDPTTANDPARELAALQEFVNSTFADPDVFGRDGDRYAEALFKRQDFLASDFRTHLASTPGVYGVEAMCVVKK